MTRPMFRAITVSVSLAVLAACSENSPVAPSGTDAAFASGSGSTSKSTSTSTKQEILLTVSASSPFQSADGKAKYAAKSGERELQVEIEDIPAGTAVTFAYNGVVFGTATASALGEARVNVNTKLKQTVPMVTAGGKVTVSTAAGVEIASGSF